MKRTSMILESDFYKQAHAEQYPKGVTKLISYATARMTRMPKEMYGDKLTVFGIQAYVKDFLIERFNETFFNVPLEEAMAEYEEIIGETFPIQYVNTGKFEALHKLGYLPVEVGCLAEGTRVPIRSAFELPEGQCQVPFMYIINTHPDFPWITEFLESVTSSEVWYPMAIANQAYYYRQIVNEWYNKTGCDANARKSAISEFGFRGGKSSDAAIKASSAFLTSFNKTATIPAIKYMRDYYGDPVKEIGGGMISTEHSVMCSNFAVDNDVEYIDLEGLNTDEIMEVVETLSKGDLVKSKSGLFECTGIFNVEDDKYIKNKENVIEICNGTRRWRFRPFSAEEVFLKKLLGKLYPAGAVSVVMDTYDYWANLQRCGKGKLKNIIMNRPGTVFFRGDSGDPVDIICGEIVGVYKSLVERQCIRGIAEDTVFVEDEKCWYRLESNTWVKYTKEPMQVLGTVGLLAKMFGYTTNEAGYKVLDSHVRAIYGDSITPNRARQMYERLAEKGFAACNVALGAGSFSTQCAETVDGKLLPFTRDSYGIAVKATWCEAEKDIPIYTERAIEDKDMLLEMVGRDIALYNVNCSITYKAYIDENLHIHYGETLDESNLPKVKVERQLFKNPKTDTGKFKKSQKGLIYVTEENGEIVAYDGYTTDTIPKEGNLLQPIFRDGKMLKETTLAEIRNKLHNNNF